VTEQPTQVPQDPRSSNKICHQPKRYGYLTSVQEYVLLMNQDKLMIYQNAITGPKSEKYIVAFTYEMDSMYTNKIWTYVEPS